MNPYSNQAAMSYRQAAAAVHPTVAVVKLYDATLLAMHQAIKFREAGKPEECFIKVMRAATILRGLDHALDYDKGGAVAERLHKVYQGYILSLHLSYGKKDVVARYRKLYDSLSNLRESWASVAKTTANITVPQLDHSASQLGDANLAAPAAPAAPIQKAPAQDRFDADAFVGLTIPASPDPERPRPRPIRSNRSEIARVQIARNR